MKFPLTSEAIGFRASMNPAIILGLVRHVLTIGAGALASRGVIAENEAETVVGAILALVGVLWSALDKRNR